MTVEIVNPVPVEDVRDWQTTLAQTFLSNPYSEERERFNERGARDWSSERTWGARDGDRYVGTLRTVKRTITVPGRDGATELVTADALTAVTVNATHRRQGLLRRMIGQSLRAARERGDALSMLIAAEWPIYGRFGYAPATQSARYELQRMRRGSTVEGDVSRVRTVEMEQFAAVAPAVFETARRRRGGQVDRDQPWWDRTLGLDGWPRVDRQPHNWVIHDGPDGPDGLLVWTAHEDESPLPPNGRLETSGVIAVSDEAERDLWAYLTGIDLIDRIELWGPVDEPARWLLGDGRTLLTTGLVDDVWLRLLDVPAALAARRYAVADELVLEVGDEGEVSVAGRYRLGADGDHVVCEPTGAEPDLVLTQRALASIYLGGFSLRGQTITGAVSERTRGAIARVDAMFATAPAPWNATGF